VNPLDGLPLPEQLAAKDDLVQGALFGLLDALEGMSSTDLTFIASAARQLRPNVRGSAVRFVEVLDRIGGLAAAVLIERAAARSRPPP
jgi:hypothetical protein